MEKVIKEHEWKVKGIGKKEPSMLPMHPDIMYEMSKKQLARDEIKPEELARKKKESTIPDIRNYM